MKVALFAGTFDPPHLAHLAVASAAQHEFALDQVWWIPSGVPPHKADRAVTAFAHRLEMVRLAVTDIAAFRVRDLEGHRVGPSYTVDTVQALVEANPDASFRLLMGEDNLRLFHTWKSPERLAELVPLIIYRRTGQQKGPVPAYLEGRVHYCTAPLISLAGTTIRTHLAQGLTDQSHISERVRTYIEVHGLYRPSR